MAPSAINRELLTTYEGLHISAICTAVRFVDDAQNHCAHFVNHVLGISEPLSCGQLLGRPGAAANVRVHETFALCPTVGKFEDRPADPCFAFVVQRSAVDLATRKMQNVPKKHIGILCDGEIWHYSNAQRRVVRQLPAQFAQHFSGDGFALFFGTFPAAARALTVPTALANEAPDTELPELKRGMRDNVDVAVWQQFLIVRQLLTGPNIRTLLDGSFGPNTEDATEAFQISVGLPANGVVDAATNVAAVQQGFAPRIAAVKRKALTTVTPAMTDAAVDALHRLGSVSVFYTEEMLNIGGQRIVARLEPHKHLEGTQLRFWHRGITLYSFEGNAVAPAAPPLTPIAAGSGSPGESSSLAAVGHAGMDTSTYPGDSIMAELRAKTNLVWTGFYLAPAPSHPGTSWMGKRALLLQQGWGLAPLYVGQQESGPGSHHVSAAQGTLDGDNAVALAQQAGFPAGSIVYLDVETGGPLSTAMRGYVQNWCARLSAGGFVPGAYLSHTSADSTRQAVPGLKLWVFRVRTADTNTEKDPPFRSSLPSESGVADAIAWQWAQNCKIAAGGGGHQLVDLDTASTADPSRA
jgi:hypothetical protein